MFSRILDYFFSPNEKKISLVKEFIGAQIEQLRSEGERLRVNDVTYAYVMSAVCMITKKPGSLAIAKEIIRSLIPEDDYLFEIENGYQIAKTANDFWDKCNALIPVVSEELRAGGGSYLFKYTKKSNKKIMGLFNPIPDLDPSKVDPLEFLKV